MALQKGIAERLREDARSFTGPATPALLRRFADSSDRLADVRWAPVPRPLIDPNDIRGPVAQHGAAERLRMLAEKLESDSADEIERLTKAGAQSAEWQRQYETARIDLEAAKAQRDMNEQLLTETERLLTDTTTQLEQTQLALFGSKTLNELLFDQLAKEQKHYRTLQRVNGYLIEQIEAHEQSDDDEDIEVVLVFGDEPGLTPAEAVALMLGTVDVLGGVEIR